MSGSPIFNATGVSSSIPVSVSGQLPTVIVTAISSNATGTGNANTNSFRTPNTSTELLFREQTVNAAAYLAAIAWAIVYKAVSNIVKSKNRRNLRWIPFIGALFICATVSMCCFVNFNEQAWIDQRGFPGGSLFLVKASSSTAAMLFSTNAGSLFLSQSGLRPFWVCPSDRPLTLYQPSIDLAMAFNIVVAATLLGRLIYFAVKVPTSFPIHIRNKFVRADAILTESVLFLGLISLVYVCLFGEGMTGANLFFPLIVQLEAIFPTLIVIRLVQGWGWDSGVIYRKPTDYHYSYARGILSDTDSEVATAVEKTGMHSVGAEAA
ncbi:hypothetical protein EUX98_g1569 [Antrodiella citrinella]|uniref:Uncharacterized protein n=1 Tax=Antrodiella citrinella TaxID=2447956 RepID=A0A4S4N431_9APHY|nr:hypothetical protein EUX98_g1569 [Antrodiella citrinella]